jgi:C4-dicarboxylate transporter DctM subunit
MIFGILFIVGMFVQTTPAIVILAPTLLAVSARSASIQYISG